MQAALDPAGIGGRLQALNAVRPRADRFVVQEAVNDQDAPCVDRHERRQVTCRNVATHGGCERAALEPAQARVFPVLVVGRRKAELENRANAVSRLARSAGCKPGSAELVSQPAERILAGRGDWRRPGRAPSRSRAAQARARACLIPAAQDLPVRDTWTIVRHDVVEHR